MTDFGRVPTSADAQPRNNAPTGAGGLGEAKQGSVGLPTDALWNAVSAFANCERAVAHVRGSYVPMSRHVSIFRVYSAIV